MHKCKIITVDTDALVLKHHGISIRTVDQISIVLDLFQKNNTYRVHNIRKLNQIKKSTQLYKG